MVTEFVGARRAFTCGFGPGHHAHPIHTLAIAQLPPAMVRIADITDGVVTAIHEDGGASRWWHHDAGAIRSALVESDGVVFLHDERVLRVGGRLFSVSADPSPCRNAGAHLDPQHPAWIGPPTGATPHEGKVPKSNYHPEPGHHLPFWRLEQALAQGPGRAVAEIDVRGTEIILEFGDERLRRRHHNLPRIRAALREVIDGEPYQHPRAPWHTPIPEWEQWSAPSFGDAPVASWLDDEILRIGDCYFWLAPLAAPRRSCGYRDDPQSQYQRQKMSAMYQQYQYAPAPTESVHLTEIARRVANRFDPWFGQEGSDEAEVTGILAPVGDVSTPGARGAAAERIVASLTPLVRSARRRCDTGIALYGEPVRT